MTYFFSDLQKQKKKKKKNERRTVEHDQTKDNLFF